MSEETWGAVDRYIAERLVDEDDALRAALAASDAAGLPAGTITSNQTPPACINRVCPARS